MSGTSPPASGDGRTPVSIVGGFLGSGKTTLLKHLLRQPGMADTALIINEFGEVGLDHLLVGSALENTLMLDNGCVCCSMRGDLVDTIADLFAKVAAGEVPAFSRILVETTGLADPGPIMRDILQEPVLRERCRLARVVVLVDGVLGTGQLRGTQEAPLQLAQADIVLVSKADLAEPNSLNLLVGEIRVINPDAAVQQVVRGAVDPDLLFGGHRQPSAHIHGHLHEQLDGPGEHAHGEHHRHGGVESWSRTIDRPVAWHRLRDWLDLLYSLHAADILRMKGIVPIEESDGAVLLHGVSGLVSEPEILPARDGGAGAGRLVVIVRGIAAQRLEASFRAMVCGEGQA